MRTLKKIIAAVVFIAGCMCMAVDPDTLGVWQTWVVVASGLALMACGFVIWASTYESKARKERRKLAQRRKAA